jgi:hypothetical protein
LWSACTSGNVKLVAWLVDRKKCTVDASQVLHGAVTQGSIEVVDWFRQRGVDVTSTRLHGGGSTLSTACASGHLALARKLVEWGASAETALIAVAARSGRVDVLEWLINEMDVPWSSSSLSAAAASGGIIKDFARIVRERLLGMCHGVAMMMYPLFVACADEPTPPMAVSIELCEVLRDHRQRSRVVC